ncbi:GntR family transcriptional regulator [Pannonibacter carbonis]|uniref:GntR family transcriptional regulator n=1 Tax=Pannonibacter carbonis TaxID=2067569 RepID=UPI000D105D13|nr:GntR family transcriptional regulator [Pannonibacter carbonis]
MKLQPVDISKTASVADIVFEALRKAIIEGDLKDGEPLRQDEIARLFNTSRIPVREAITMLEQQGLVTTQRYKGAVVASIAPDEVAEIFDFRALVEGTVIKAAVERMSDESRRMARQCHEAFSSSTDPMSWGDLNRQFHYTLYQDSGLPYHLGIVNNALDRIDRYLRAQLMLSNGRARAHDEHLGILEACEAGKADLAADLTRRHILGAKTSLLDHLKRK